MNTRLDQIVQRHTGRIRERLFILAVALVTSVTAGSIAFASTGNGLARPAEAAKMAPASDLASNAPCCTNSNC